MLVLGLNLGIDRTMRLEQLLPGYVLRPRSVEVTAGGKAVNVCRAATGAHGERPRLVANLPGRAGALVAAMLAEEDHDVCGIVTAGEARSQLILIEDDLRITVLNEPGPQLSPDDRDRLLTAFTGELESHRVAVATGSLPPGAPDDTYGEVARRARSAGVVSVIDAARDALRSCLAAQPDVVTPNLAEAEAALHGASDEAVDTDSAHARSAALAAAAGLRGAGARAALVTVGRHGVAGADDAGTFWIAASPVREVNPIGAGDSFVAGLAVALERGSDLRAAALCAVATGSASVAHALAGGVDPQLVAGISRKLVLERE